MQREWDFFYEDALEHFRQPEFNLTEAEARHSAYTYMDEPRPTTELTLDDS